MTKQDLKQAKIEILKEASKIKYPFNVTEELKIAYANSRAIDKFLLQKYFSVQKSPSKAEKQRKLKRVLKIYEQDVLKKLLKVKDDFENIRIETKANKQNLFLIAGTKNLFLSNKYTRTITTTLGNRLESIIEIDKSTLLILFSLRFLFSNTFYLIYKFYIRSSFIARIRKIQ